MYKVNITYELQHDINTLIAILLSHLQVAIACFMHRFDPQRVSSSLH